MYDLLEPEIISILKKYKTDRATVIDAINSYISKNIEFRNIIENTKTQKDLYKRSEYKTFSKKLRKEIYFGLRKYHTNNIQDTTIDFETASKEHISTKERLPYIDSFNSQILSVCSESRIILDLGGGLYPILFPFTQTLNLKKYVWLDKDKNAYDTLVKYQQANPKAPLSLVNRKIGDIGINSLLEENEIFDCIFMFKLLPVIFRQERNVFNSLTRLQSKKIIITASKESMTKNISIKKREDLVLKKFVELSGRTIIENIDIANEFGYVLE